MSRLSPTSGLNKFNEPSLVTHNHLRFLIMDSPSEQNIEQYVKELVRHGATDVVRACEPHYSNTVVEQAGMACTALEFSDGDPPPADIIARWLDLVEKRFGTYDDMPTKTTANPTAASGGGGAGNTCIAVHCVAGLGRAPMLVAVALMEAGFDAIDAVTYIRKVRRGAINKRQFAFLEGYAPTRRKAASCCTVM